MSGESKAKEKAERRGGNERCSIFWTDKRNEIRRCNCNRPGNSQIFKSAHPVAAGEWFPAWHLWVPRLVLGNGENNRDKSNVGCWERRMEAWGLNSQGSMCQKVIPRSPVRWCWEVVEAEELGPPGKSLGDWGWCSWEQQCREVLVSSPERARQKRVWHPSLSLVLCLAMLWLN